MNTSMNKSTFAAGSQNVRDKINNLSSALGALKSNFKNEQGHQEQQSQLLYDDVQDLKGDIKTLKSGFRTIVDQVLEELDNVRNEVAVLGTELQNQSDHQKTELDNKIELLDIKQNSINEKSAGIYDQTSSTSQDLIKRMASLENETGLSIEGISINQKEAFEYLGNIVNIHKSQLDGMMAQNSSIEVFMADVVNTIQQHQKKMTELGEQVFTVEGNNDLFQNEMKNIAQEVEKKCDVYKESTSSDQHNVINIQRETNKNIQEFVDSISMKQEAIESSITTKLKSFEEILNEVAKDRNELGFDKADRNMKLNEIEVIVKNAIHGINGNNGKTNQLEKKLDNFRNEVNTLFIDYEQTWNDRFKEYGVGVDSLRKRQQAGGL